MGCAASKAPPKADASPATAEAGPVELPEGSTWYKLGGAELEPCLASAFVVDVRWLLKFALGEVMPECEGVLPAWQQLPAAAEVKLEDLRRSKMKYNLPVGVTSYGWDSKARVKALSPSPRRAYTTCSRFSRGRGREGAGGAGSGGCAPDPFACSPLGPSPLGPDCEALCFGRRGTRTARARRCSALCRCSRRSWQRATAEMTAFRRRGASCGTLWRCRSADTRRATTRPRTTARRSSSRSSKQGWPISTCARTPPA